MQRCGGCAGYPVNVSVSIIKTTPMLSTAKSGKIRRCPTCGNPLFVERYLRDVAVRCAICPFRVERFRAVAPTPKPAQEPPQFDPRICAGCGATFTPNAGIQKYCTALCGKHTRHPSRLVVAVCGYCHAEIPGATVRKRFCNDQCSQRARQRADKNLSS